MTSRSAKTVPPCPELLAPAGSFDALKAGIGNGADACYLGVGAFNARRQAENLTVDQLAEAVDLAHLRSVRLYLTLNTLITDREMDEAVALAGAAYEAGIDAVIVQDIGLASVLHHELPDLVLHASTQMTLTEPADFEAAAKIGIRRVVLPRELSLQEIRDLSQAAGLLGLETEVFVHGALCMSFSGQCLLSTAIGGRSGNRGECAGPCRLPWLLSAKTGRGPYPWLSPRDQALIDHLSDLAQAGVASLKIEGRMRSPAYVGQVTGVYRTALDADQVPDDRLRESSRQTLLLAFNRGGSLTDRYLAGNLKEPFLSGPYAGSHGVLLGMVGKTLSRLGELHVVMDPTFPLDSLPSRGDVLSVRDASGRQEKNSCPIGTIEQRGRVLVIKGFHPDILDSFKLDDPVYLMNSSQLEKQALDADLGKTGIVIFARQEENRLTLKAGVTDKGLADDEIQTRIDLSDAIGSELDPERVSKQLKKSGNTPFRVEQVILETPIKAKISEINNGRRQLLAALGGHITEQSRRSLPPGWTGRFQPAIDRLALKPVEDPKRQVCVFYHRLAGPFDSLACQADIYMVPIVSLDEQNGPELVLALRQAEPTCQILAWLPAAAVGKPARLVRQNLSRLTAWGFDGVVSGHCGLAGDGPFVPVKRVDSGANVLNQAALAYYARQTVESACLSPELDDDLVISLAESGAAKALPVEWQVYGRLRVMTSAFCPIGQNQPGCKLCHPDVPDPMLPDLAVQQTLTDRQNQAFPLIVHPAACFGEVLSHFHLARSQALVELASGSNGSGRIARLAFNDETPEERRALVADVRRLISARSRGAAEQANTAFLKTAGQVVERLGSWLKKTDMTDLMDQTMGD